MELITKEANAYSKTCLGCQNRNSDVMLTFTGDIVNREESFHDIHLTTQQAKDFITRLNQIIQQNEKDEE